MKLARTAIFFVVLVMLFAMLVASAWAAPIPQCGQHEDMLEAFKTKYQEEPSVWGLTNVGALLEVLVSEDGTWTVLVTVPQTMVACVVATGTDWVAGDFILGEDA